MSKPRLSLVSSAILGLIACSTSAPPPVAPVPAAVVVPPPIVCPDRLAASDATLHRLLDQGELDQALALTNEDPRGCGGLASAQDAARLVVLRRLAARAELLTLARKVKDGSAGTPEGRALATEILAAPPSPEDDLLLAERMLERARTTPRDAERRESYDIALHAFERATGEAPQAVALTSNRVELQGDATAFTLVTAEPAGTAHVAAHHLAPRRDGERRRVAPPFRLLGSGKSWPSLSSSASGSVVVTQDDRGQAYRTLSSAPRLFEGGRRYDVAGDALVIARPDALEVQSLAEDRIMMPAVPVALSADALSGARRSADERYWIACQRDVGAAVVLDLHANRLTSNLRNVVGCAVDPRRQALVVLGPADPSVKPAFLDLIPFSGAPATHLPLPDLGKREGESLTLSVHDDLASVGFEKTVFVDLAQGRVVTRIPKTRVGPAALDAVPVGQAGENHAAVAPLRALAKPPRKVLDPYFASVHTWMGNGVKSFDGATVAVFTGLSKDEDSSIKLVIADTAPLRVRHEISIDFGRNWLTAYFLDDRYLVVQSYPAYEIYDVIRGKYLFSADLGDCGDERPRAGGLFLCRDQLWDLAPDPANLLEKRTVALGVTPDGTWRGTAPERSFVDGNSKEETLRFNADGKVILSGDVVPDFLHCRFGDRLAPFAVCQRRVLAAAN